MIGLVGVRTVLKDVSASQQPNATSLTCTNKAGTRPTAHNLMYVELRGQNPPVQYMRIRNIYKKISKVTNRTSRYPHIPTEIRIQSVPLVSRVIPMKILFRCYHRGIDILCQGSIQINIRWLSQVDEGYLPDES